MNKNYKAWIAALVGAVFFILVGVFISIALSQWVHNRDIATYGLVEASGRSLTSIQQDYRHLRDYLWLFHQAPLQLDHFPMSATGRIHFDDVKRFVDGLQVVMIGSGALFGYLMYRLNDWTVLDKLWKLMLILPLTIALLAMANFSAAFVIFHKLIFSNDYWIFDVVRDPVILILPEGFFFHMFLLIVAVIVLLAFIIYGISRHGFNLHKK